MGYSQHAGMVVLADGTDRADDCLRRVLAAVGVGWALDMFFK